MSSQMIAVLDTSTARKVRWSNNEIVESEASERLVELIDEGYTVYIASTRRKMDPQGCDKCLFDLIPEDRFFVANPGLETGHACAPANIDLWTRVLEHLGIVIPVNDSSFERSWMDLREIAGSAGIVIR